MTISSTDKKYCKKQKNNYYKQNAILKVLFKNKKELKQGTKSKKIGPKLYQRKKKINLKNIKQRNNSN